MTLVVCYLSRPPYLPIHPFSFYCFAECRWIHT